ncbi:hypothetical protein D9M71_306410 [compost metagenome]
MMAGDFRPQLQQRIAGRVIQEVVAQLDVLAHGQGFLFIERTRLEQDMIWNTYLADIMHGGGQAKLVDPWRTAAIGTGQQGGTFADADHVVTALVVAVFGHPHQTTDDHFRGSLHFPGALLDALFEQSTLVVQLDAGEPEAEMVAQTQEHFLDVHRLAQVVADAEVQGTAAAVDIAVGGNRDDRQALRQVLAQQAEDLEAAGPGDVEVEQQQVPGVFQQPRQALGGVAEHTGGFQAGRLEGARRQGQVTARRLEQHDIGLAQVFGNVQHGASVL